MDMTGSYAIPAPRTAVWAALNDPDALKACIPGCEELAQISPTEFEATVLARIGPVKARFKGRVALTDLNPPQGYRISGEGSGGVAGFAKGGAAVTLAEDGEGTLLSYAATAQIGGKLAQLGSRLVDGVAKKMADEFFESFADRLAPKAAEPATATPAAGEGTEAQGIGARMRGWLGARSG